MVVSTERVIDLRRAGQSSARQLTGLRNVQDGGGSAVNAPAATRNTVEHDDSFATNAILGTVKATAKGYGTVTRKGRWGECSFSPTVSPGALSSWMGWRHRNCADVVKVSSGKWQAQRVVRS